MWGEFVLAAAFCLFALYLPGYLAARSIVNDRASALAVAPVLPFFFYTCIGLICGFADVPCSWALCFIPLLCIAFVAFLISCLRRRGGRVEKPSGSFSNVPLISRSWFVLAVYCLVGVAISIVFFLVNIGEADSFVQEYDNVSHLSRIQTFLSSGDWSCFGNSFYPDSDPNDPVPSSGFYPAAWHVLVAMTVDAAGVPITVAVNATIFIVIAIVFSSGFFLLLRTIFKGNVRLQLAGSLCVFAFAAFPWKLLVFGPIYPNLVSLCLTPVVAACFIFSTSKDILPSRRFAGLAGILVGFGALMLLQPNTVFTLAVFLAPYCIWRIYVTVSGSVSPLQTDKTRIVGIAACCAFAFAAMALWMIAYRLPALQDLVSFDWPAFIGRAQAILNVLLLSFRETEPQPFLSLLVWTGVVYTIRHRQYLWISVSFAIMSVMYVSTAATTGELKHILTGFWYTDAFRIGANAAIFAIPLATMGLYTCARLICRAIQRLPLGRDCAPVFSKAVSCLGCCLIVLGAYCFGPAAQAFGTEYNEIKGAYSASMENVLSPEEKSFLREVAETVPEGSVIVNEPNDGSAYGYALFDLNLYYRSMNGYDSESATRESEVIRLGIDDYSSDPIVRKAVDDIGAAYLLQLDQADWDISNRYLFSYDSEGYRSMWAGVDAVDDKTPGFEIILAEDDMRLYKIA